MKAEVHTARDDVSMTGGFVVIVHGGVPKTDTGVVMADVDLVLIDADVCIVLLDTAGLRISPAINL